MSFFGLFGPPNVHTLFVNRDVPGLIGALTYQKDAGVRRSAAEAALLIGDDRMIGPLVAALTDSASDVRHAAAQALESINISWSSSVSALAAVPTLIAVIEDYGTKDNRIAVHSAVMTLGKIRDGRAIEALIKAVERNSDSNVRYAAVEMLAEIGDPRSIKPLIDALIDSEYVVCKAAARALPKIDVNWTTSEAARAAVPMFISALEKSERTLRDLADTPEEEETINTPDLKIPGIRSRNRIRAATEMDSKTVSWAAKEALKLVNAKVD